MQWLIIQDADGAWDSISLETVEAIQFDGRETLYVFRKGLPPKGAHPMQVSLAPEPYIGGIGSNHQNALGGRA